jgi:hypothetical protein
MHGDTLRMRMQTDTQRKEICSVGRSIGARNGFQATGKQFHMPGKFYKGRSQEKTRPLRLEFFLLRSPGNGAGAVLTARTKYSVAGHYGPALWVFSTSGFHRFLATKPVRSETSKAERGQIWRPSFYLGLLAHRFFWLSERA